MRPSGWDTFFRFYSFASVSFLLFVMHDNCNKLFRPSIFIENARIVDERQSKLSCAASYLIWLMFHSYVNRALDARFFSSRKAQGGCCSAFAHGRLPLETFRLKQTTGGYIAVSNAEPTSISVRVDLFPLLDENMSRSLRNLICMLVVHKHTHSTPDRHTHKTSK